MTAIALAEKTMKVAVPHPYKNLLEFFSTRYEVSDPTTSERMSAEGILKDSLPTQSIFAGLPNNLIMSIVKMEGSRVKVETQRWYAERKPSEGVALRMEDMVRDIDYMEEASQILKETIADTPELQELQQQYGGEVGDIIDKLKRVVRECPGFVACNGMILI